MDKKMPSRHSSFHFPFPTEWNPRASQTPQQPQEEDEDYTGHVGPSPHGIILPRALLGLQLGVAVHVLPPAVPDRHEDTKQDQDDAAGTSNCRCQNADF